MTTTDERTRSASAEQAGSSARQVFSELSPAHMRLLAERLGYESCAAMTFADPEAALESFGGPEGLAAFLAAADEPADY